ncbi:hypothetical protein WN943_010547 [Citrus x changshan-huyou]
MVKIVQEAQVEETPTVREDDIIEMILPIRVKGSRIILEDNFPKNLYLFCRSSFQREGGSLAHPPVLDGTNYAYWKQRMEIYLTTIDKRVWQCVLTGYTPPIKIDEDGVESPKPVRECTNDELDASGYNAKRLNVIVNGVDVFQH